MTVCDRVVDCPHSTPKWVESGKLCLRTTNFKRGYLDLSEKIMFQMRLSMSEIKD